MFDALFGQHDWSRCNQWIASDRRHIFFFDSHRAEAIAAKSMPNTAREVSLPETSISDLSMIKSNLYEIGRGHETLRLLPISL